MLVSVLPHVLVGTVALSLYWMALLVKKGSGIHRRAGKFCLILLVLTGLLVGPILVVRSSVFDPSDIVQMVYLTACLATVSMLAYNSIRFKTQPEKFRSRAFRIFGPLLLVLGLIVLSAGIIKRDPVAMVLSWVGLTYGLAMIAFARYRGTLQPRWWMSWHLNAVSGLFNAVNGTVLYVLARWMGLVSEGPLTQTMFQIITIAAAVGLRLWFGRTFNAPLRFGTSTQVNQRYS